MTRNPWAVKPSTTSGSVFGKSKIVKAEASTSSSSPTPFGKIVSVKSEPLASAESVSAQQETPVSESHRTPFGSVKPEGETAGRAFGKLTNVRPSGSAATSTIFGKTVQKKLEGASTSGRGGVILFGKPVQEGSDRKPDTSKMFNNPTSVSQPTEESANAAVNVPVLFGKVQVLLR